jgi:hypothetical protein
MVSAWTSAVDTPRLAGGVAEGGGQGVDERLCWEIFGDGGQPRRFADAAEDAGDDDDGEVDGHAGGRWGDGVVLPAVVWT